MRLKKSKQADDKKKEEEEKMSEEAQPEKEELSAVATELWNIILRQMLKQNGTLKYLEVEKLLKTGF